MKRFLGILFALVLVFSLAGLLTSASVAQAQTTFTVNTTDDIDDGTCDATHCSLREAINAANATPGTDIIEFNIPGAWPHTIQPASTLPTITDPVVIDGYTQPGATPNTNGAGLGINAVLMIELDGSMMGGGANGLTITAGSSTVRGLVINRFVYPPFIQTGGSGIALSGNGGNVIDGNFIGTDIAGTASFGNSIGISIDRSNSNTIGGTTPEARNVISGNAGYAVTMFAVWGTGNLVRGNLIGTDVTGTAALGNGGGVRMESAINNTIGGTTAGARNIISGNKGNGVHLAMEAARQNVVQGNFIGTDISGTAKLANSSSGVWVERGSNNIIGGTTTGVGNLISGNNGYGVRITGASGNLIQGNLIGTDVTGTAPLGNNEDGVFIRAVNNTIGGPTAGARNVISGNNGTGVRICGYDASGNLVQGNFIGTDITGTTALSNGLHGVDIYGAPDNTVGGVAAGAGNVISANKGVGVRIGSKGATAKENLVQGNFIGTDITGIADLGNTLGGVLIYRGPKNIIGGTMAGASNTIAYNGGDGISLTEWEGQGYFSIDIRILSNSIFANAGLGIDLGGDGVTPNDTGDADMGANNLQNFPVLNSATSGSGTTIEGTLNSTPNTKFRLEFFANTECDPSGYGEGETFLGFTNVTTDDSGNVAFTVTFPDTVPGGHFITATATDPDGNTSEFSACLQVTTAVVEAAVDFDPDTLNLKSKGKVVTVYIELPEGYDVEKTDISTVMLNGIVPALAHPTEIGDYDGDGITDLMVKFDRSDVQDVLEPGNEVEIELSGELTDGTLFEGTDMIRVIAKGKK